MPDPVKLAVTRPRPRRLGAGGPVAARGQTRAVWRTRRRRGRPTPPTRWWWWRISGLAIGTLAREGREVTLVEATDEVGGRAGSWSSGGFRFDTGPSWFLMPEVFDHFFRLCGTSSAEQLDLVRLDPGYRVYFEGRPEPVDVRSDRRLHGAVRALEPGQGRWTYLDSARATTTSRFGGSSTRTSPRTRR